MFRVLSRDNGGESRSRSRVRRVADKLHWFDFKKDKDKTSKKEKRQSLKSIGGGSNTPPTDSRRSSVDFSNWFKFTDKERENYVFNNILGVGGSAEVWEATDKRTGKLVAIKVVEKDSVEDPEEQLRRMKMVQEMDHPGIIKIFSWFETKTQYCTVSEVAEGGELFKHLVNEGCFSEEETKSVVKVLIDALAYIHAKNVVHRDIKPENVLCRSKHTIDFKGHADCGITDFGVGIMLRDSDIRLHDICGTPGYTAPELFDEEGYSFPVDCWSFGVMVYALMGGTFPYSAIEPRALAEEAKSSPLTFPKEQWSEISDLAKDFISGLLTVNPTKRLTAEEAKNHPWLTRANLTSVPTNDFEAMDTVSIAESSMSGFSIVSNDSKSTQPQTKRRHSRLEKRPGFAVEPCTKTPI